MHALCSVRGFRRYPYKREDGRLGQKTLTQAGHSKLCPCFEGENQNSSLSRGIGLSPLSSGHHSAPMHAATNYVRDILTAHIDDIAQHTPLTPALSLSQRCGNDIILKREDQQPIFSFKIRGAANKLRQLSADQRAAGVIAASAGNHAQGVAIAAQRLDVSATIVMPLTTPQIKVSAVRRLGAQVILHGDAFDQALQFALHRADQEGLTFLHPYDDPAVIAGQGTVAMELSRQAGEQLDAVFVPVGGGGLLAGVAAYFKAIRPEVLIVGVEPADAACCQAALQAGEPVTLPSVGLFADGVAVARLGDHPWEVIKDTVDTVVTVSTDAMCAAVKDIFEATRVVTEPAGALGLAGLLQHCDEQGWQGSAALPLFQEQI